MKIIIAGCRDFSDYNVFIKGLIEVFNQAGICLDNITTILSGGCRGVDRMAERFAREMTIPCTIFPADWDEYGKRAGYIRNAQMVQQADILIAFWDKASPGTKMIIDLMKGKNKEIFIFDISEDV